MEPVRYGRAVFPQRLYLDQQAIDTTTPAGKLMFQVTGAFAEFERSMIRQSINAGLKRAVQAAWPAEDRSHQDIDCESSTSVRRPKACSASLGFLYYAGFTLRSHANVNSGLLYKHRPMRAHA